MVAEVAKSICMTGQARGTHTPRAMARMRRMTFKMMRDAPPTSSAEWQTRGEGSDERGGMRRLSAKELRGKGLGRRRGCAAAPRVFFSFTLMASSLFPVRGGVSRVNQAAQNAKCKIQICSSVEFNARMLRCDGVGARGGVSTCVI